MKTYTDVQLRQALGKMLPDMVNYFANNDQLWWKYPHGCGRVLDTELLHLCWLVEESLPSIHPDLQWSSYQHLVDTVRPERFDNDDWPTNHTDWLWNISHASWQQRTIALAKVKGIEL